MIDCINQSRQTVALLMEIRDSLFTNWKFGFVFDPRLYDLQLLVIELFLLCIMVLYGELIECIIVFTKLDKPSLSNKLPVSIKPSQVLSSYPIANYKKCNSPEQFFVQIQTPLSAAGWLFVDLLLTNSPIRT